VLFGLGGDPTVFEDERGWCATFGFDIGRRGQSPQVVVTGVFNANGVLEREKFVRDRVQGRRVFFQAAERGTCPDECMSNIIERVVQ